MPQTGDITALYTKWKNIMLRPKVKALGLGGTKSLEMIIEVGKPLASIFILDFTIFKPRYLYLE